MKKYIINWECNNGTSGMFESNNRRESVKAVREILKDETFLGNSYYYDITETAGYGIVKSECGRKNMNGNLIKIL